MAELNSAAQHAQRRGVRRSKKLSTRVDLTPMVDLGFLLITFFMVSTTWSKPKAAILRMPADGPPTEYGNNAVLTLVALKENKIFYYNGDLDQSLKEGSYGVAGYRQNEGVGDVIRRKQQAMDRSYKGGRKELMLLIKPSPESDYQNVVSLLDEALINDIKRYALIDLPAAEQATVMTLATKPR
jgi:biopolymer transport protein ExbD